MATFSGYDWTELAHVWGYDLQQSDDELEQQVRQRILSDATCASTLREFLQLLAFRAHSDWRGVWETLTLNPSDQVVRHAVAALLSYMWE